MPTYEYRCTECDSSLEAVQKFSDAPLTVCPQCSGRLRKVFSAVGVVFKGSGFYKTDSRTSARRDGQRVDAKNAETPAKAGDTGDGAAAARTDTSADSAKPETTPTPAKAEGPKQDTGKSASTSDGGASKPSPREPVNKVA